MRWKAPLLVLLAPAWLPGCLVDPASRAPSREPERIPELGPVAPAPESAEAPPAADLASGPDSAPAPDPAAAAPLPAGSFALAPDPETAIVAGGTFVPAGTRVVHWTEPPFYDAYKPHPCFGDATPGSSAPDGPRFRVEGREDEVELFVLHYDACGTSRRCFEVLQDLRGLSVHFLLDLDGTVYQTLDTDEQAWHASVANARSVGVEIANVGAYAPDDLEGLGVLGEWYDEDADGLRLTVPERYLGPLPEDFAGRPRRGHLVPGRVQGAQLLQADFTPEQYDALADLAAAVIRAHPAIEPDAPRDADGRVRRDALSEDELAAFRGIVGHHHVTERKVDPGPAFDWERFLADVRARLERAP